MLFHEEFSLAEHDTVDAEYLQDVPVWLKFWFADHQC